MSRKSLSIISLILLAALIFTGFGYFTSQIKLRQAEAALGSKEVSKQILSFAKSFIEDVLQAENEIDFETRLKLETAVRDLSNERILASWRMFIESRTEAEAQKRVKDFLQVLVDELSTTSGRQQVVE